MLRDEIEGASLNRVRTVWFTAWKYDRQDALWRSLILRVLQALYPREDGARARAKSCPCCKTPRTPGKSG